MAHAVAHRPTLGARSSSFAGARVPTARRVPSARAAAPGPLRVSAYFWEEEVESWDSLLQKAGIDVLQGFSVARRTTVPQSSSCDWIAAVENPQGLTDKPVVLYRDANSQCPYCERVRLALAYKGIPYDTIYINLRDKPDWYVKMADGRVPAAYINGEFYVDSLNIIATLERAFPDTPALLFPKDHPGSGRLKELIEMAKLNVFYKTVTDAFTGACPKSKAMDAALDIERLLAANAEGGKGEGPFMCGAFSMVDCAFAPFLLRVDAYFDDVVGEPLSGNPRLPHLTGYLRLLREMPAYSACRMDPRSVRRAFFAPREQHEANIRRALPPPDSPAMRARREAAAKVASNIYFFTGMILGDSGLARGRTSPYGSTMTAANGYEATPKYATLRAVDFHLRRVCQYLLTGEVGRKAGNVEARCIGAVALVFFKNAVMAPRDMSAAAAEELRAACDLVIDHVY